MVRTVNPNNHRQVLRSARRAEKKRMDEDQARRDAALYLRQRGAPATYTAVTTYSSPTPPTPAGVRRLTYVPTEDLLSAAATLFPPRSRVEQERRTRMMAIAIVLYGESVGDCTLQVSGQRMTMTLTPPEPEPDWTADGAAVDPTEDCG